MQAFNIYRKTKKTSFFKTYHFFVLFSFIITFAILLSNSRVFKSDPRIISNLSAIMFVFSFILLVVLKLISFFQHKPLNGNLEGLIIFENASIIVKDRKYDLSEIQKIRVFIGDYYNKSRHRRISDCNPKLSSGVGNFVTITLVDETVKMIYFQIFKKGDFLKCREQLINYHLKGKIHFLHLIDLLKISDYNEIQMFKEELKQIQATS